MTEIFEVYGAMNRRRLGRLWDDVCTARKGSAKDQAIQDYFEAAGFLDEPRRVGGMSAEDRADWAEAERMLRSAKP